MSTRERIEKALTEMSEYQHRDVLRFVESLKKRTANESFNGLLLSESALSSDWNSPEEDAAWAYLASF